MIAVKCSSPFGRFLLSVAVYTVGYAVVQMKIYRVKAAGLPWLLNDPLYWLLMILIVGGEIWLGINKLGSH